MADKDTADQVQSRPRLSQYELSMEILPVKAICYYLAIIYTLEYNILCYLFYQFV